MNQPALWAEPGPPGAEPDGGLNPLNPGHRVAHGEAAPFRLAVTCPPLEWGWASNREERNAFFKICGEAAPLAPKARQT